MSLRCWLFEHDFIRQYEPGRLALRCQVCGYVSPGLRGPIAPAVEPVVKARKLRPKTPPALKVVRTRRTA
jgi:hypothetical protein